MGRIGGVLALVVLAILVYFSIVKMPDQTTDQAGDASGTDKTETGGSEDETFDPEPDPDAEQVSFADTRREKSQLLTEDKITEEYKDGNYTFQHPLVKVDPYDVMPLSALVMFKTEEPARVRVRVEGDDENSDIERVYDEYETVHRVPVLGLYPDAENKVSIDYMTEDGEDSEVTELTIETDPLPDDFLDPELVESQPEKMEDGLTFMIPTKKYMYAVDDNADVRWYTSLPMKLAFERLENGHILIATQDEARDQYNELVEMDMLGKVYNDYMIEIDGYDGKNLIHHDVIELPNGHLLATAHEPDSEYKEDQMIEIDRDTGETRRFINDRNLFPHEAYEDYDGKNADDNDWIHQNAIWFDKRSESVLISGRSQDTIMKLSYPDAEIDWILAADEDWPESHEPYLLDPIGDVKFPAGQHAVKVLPTQDGDPDTTDILLFDNNTVITRGDDDESDEYSRAVQYRINEKEKTVEEIWSYGEDRGTDFFSDIIGNAQYLFDTENRLITSGAISSGDDDDATTSRIVEVSGDDDPEVLYEVKTPAFERSDHRYIYRAFRLPLYPEEDWAFDFGNTKADASD